MVDDVLTKGNTMMAVARHLRDAGYQGELVGCVAAYTRDYGVGADYRTFSVRWDTGWQSAIFTEVGAAS